MHVKSKHSRLELPESLRTQMYGFRRRVWLIKLIEAGCGAVFGVLLAFLATFALDRVWDTPVGVRIGLFAAALAVCTIIPLAIHRWVWQQRQLDQLARLLTRAHPSIGDQLLGIIELVRSETEQARSIVLCEAAIEQVADQARPRDFADAVPNPKHIRRAVFAAAALLVGAGLYGAYPEALTNAWARFSKPWQDTPRYTFAMVESLPDQLVVAHGEPFSLKVRLTEDTVSRPPLGTVQLGMQQPVDSALSKQQYKFDLPPQIDTATLHLHVGDYAKRIQVQPTLRPELSSVAAAVTLPAYLERTETQKKDVRGGSVSLLNGSHATFTASATRELASATVDNQPVAPRGAEIVSPATLVEGDGKLEFQWRDEFGLNGKDPFTLSITGKDDEEPSIACEELPRRRVVLDTEQLSFQVTAQDDYGVRRVGMDWQGIDTVNFKNPAQGERIISAGGPDKEFMELAGTFSASALGIEPQPVHVRMFVEDYLPGRERVYSPTYLLYVLNAEQHAIWLTEQLSKWHRQSLDVRDRELQLYEANKELRGLASDELNDPETREKIDKQAWSERVNGRRLSSLVDSGEDLIKQAMRNPEFGVGHLEKWAEMVQILKDISSNRMPSVADLLKQASESPQTASKSGKQPPTVGQLRASGSGKGSDPDDPDVLKKDSEVPAIVDVESSQQPLKPGDDESLETPPSGGAPRLSLPTTTLLGGAKKDGDSCPVGDKMEEAVTEQRDLLAEFERIADELNRLLANLEGSTLVKRLKAESRSQYRIAGRLADQVNSAFGVPATAQKSSQRDLFKELAGQETTSTQSVSNIMDDMDAYFERRRMVQFKTVLDEMRSEDVIGGLRALGDDLAKESGLSIAQCEFWSDTLDRWAEDLVEPTSGGT